MSTSIHEIKDKQGNQALPITHERAVKDSNGTTLETKLQTINSDIDTIENTALFIDGSGTSASVPEFDAKSQTVQITPQSLSPQQKQQARTNIGVYSTAEVDNKIEALDGTAQGTSSDNHITVSVTETNGIITGVNCSTSDIAPQSNTYTKAEVRGMVQTPHQDYVTVSATTSTTSATQVLPASGSTDTIYRVSCWDGSANSGAGAYNVAVYSEYAWDEVSNPGQYVFLCVKSQIGEVFDISAYHNNETYADLSAALDSNNGGGVPQSLQRGGMSVKYVQSSDNKYVQYRLMSDTFNTTIANWQGVDDVPTDGSDNLVKSGGVQKYVKSKINGISKILNDLFYDDESGSFMFSDGNGNLAAILSEHGIKAVNFIFPDGETVLQKIEEAKVLLPIETKNGSIVEMIVGGESGDIYLADEDANISIKIGRDGKLTFIMSEMAVAANLNLFGNLINTYGKDFDCDFPEFVFGIESGTLNGREYFTSIYPEALVHENIPVLIDGSKKAVIQLRKSNNFSNPPSVHTSEVSFSIGGNGYRKKDFSLNYVRANRKNAIGKNIGLLAIGDSITALDAYFPVTSDYGYGSWQDWIAGFSVMDNADDNNISIVKTIGTRKEHDNGIKYNDETLAYKGYCEGRSGWSTYGYLNYPCWARIDIASQDKGRFDARIMYYAAGLATETPFDSNTPGHEFIEYNLETYLEKIVHTPMGRFKPDCCDVLWNDLKRVYSAFREANPEDYSAATSNAIIIAFLDSLMDYPDTMTYSHNGDGNPFYDKARARAYTGEHQWTYTNAFSLTKYLSRYRNCDDEGTPLVGNAGETVIGGDGNTYTIGTNKTSKTQVFMPTHVISALGTNDTDAVFVECEMELLNTLVAQGVQHVGYWLPRRPGVLNPQIWNEYGLQYQIGGFAYEKNNAIRTAIGGLNISNAINYIPAFFTISPISTGYVDRLAYDLDYTDKQNVVCGTDSVHPSAFFVRSAAYQCLAWIYWTLQ